MTEIDIQTGDLFTLGSRTVIVAGGRNYVMRDHRGRVAVRNTQTNRLSYIPEWRLLKARKSSWPSSGASTP